MFINSCIFHLEVLMMFSCRLGGGFLKRIPSILQGWIQLLLGNGKGFIAIKLENLIVI